MESKTSYFTPFEALKFARSHYSDDNKILKFRATELNDGWVLVLCVGRHDQYLTHDAYISDPNGVVKLFLSPTELLNVAIFISRGKFFDLEVLPKTPDSPRLRA